MTDCQLDPAFVQMLACPVSHHPVEQEGAWLVCRAGEPPRRYPIRDGIPVMLEAESQVFIDGEWGAAAEQSG